MSESQKYLGPQTAHAYHMQTVLEVARNEGVSSAGMAQLREACLGAQESFDEIDSLLEMQDSKPARRFRLSVVAGMR